MGSSDDEVEQNEQNEQEDENRDENEEENAENEEEVEEKDQFSAQCFLIGDIGIGKSSIIAAFADNKFPFSSPENSSLHDDFIAEINVDGQTVKLEICEG